MEADLFRRVAEVLRPGGRFVLGDVVVPDRPEDAVLGAELVWTGQDLAVLRGDRPG